MQVYREREAHSHSCLRQKDIAGIAPKLSTNERRRNQKGVFIEIKRYRIHKDVDRICICYTGRASSLKKARAILSNRIIVSLAIDSSRSHRRIKERPKYLSEVNFR